MRFLVWKWRKYPIKRDEEGRSLRQQAFELFDKECRPAEICKQQLVTASLKTLLRYYEDWKKTGGHASSRILQRVRKNNPDFTEQMIKTLSMLLEMPIEEVIKRMQRPWGLQQALRGQWPDYSLRREQRDVEARLMGGLRFIRMAKLFQNSPYELAELLLQITMLKDNVKLEITRTEGQLVVTKEEKGRLTTLKLDY
jgi:hypothetical protein